MSTSTRCFDFLTDPKAREASADLEHIRFSGGELILNDQTLGRTLRARDAELNIDFLADRVAADLQIRDRTGGATRAFSPLSKPRVRARTR